MPTISSKRFIQGLGVAMLGLMAWHYVSAPQAPLVEHAAGFDASTPKLAGTARSTARLQPPANGAPISTANKPAISSMASPRAASSTLSAAEEAEAKSWIEAHGRLENAQVEYGGYDLETLKTLVKNGDLQVASVLGRALLKAQGAEVAKQFYRETAVRGSVVAVYDLADLVAKFDYSRAETDEARRSAALEVISLYELAKLRGNPWLNEVIEKPQVDGFVAQVQPTLAEAQGIKMRSQELYSQLQAERRELGLGEFDNSVPASVSKYIDQGANLKE